MSSQSIVITGASTGIGYAIAQRFASAGWQVFGSVRKQEDGARLEAELGVRPLRFDVTDAAAVRDAAAEVADALGRQTLGALVNNAGMAISGPLLYLPEDQLERQIEVNVMGPFRVTQLFASLLGADRQRQGKPGRIVQMSSVSGSIGVPFLGPYCASKHALEGMSEALRRELLLFGIAVSVIAPGAIVTPIWEKGGLSDLSQYHDTPYASALRKFESQAQRAGRAGLPASRVADAVWHAVTSPKPRLRYEVVPRKFREWTLPSLLPKRLLDKAMGKALGLKAS